MIQCFGQFLLVHVMLVLSDTNGFRVDFYQLCEWVLQAARHGCRTSLSDIKLRKLFGRQLAGRVYGGTGFVYNDVLYGYRNLFEKLYDDLLGFAGSSTVSKGD